MFEVHFCDFLFAFPDVVSSNERALSFGKGFSSRGTFSFHYRIIPFRGETKMAEFRTLKIYSFTEGVVILKMHRNCNSHWPQPIK